MDVIYARGEATALEVLGQLADPPSKTAVRTLLRILEEKGHLRHAHDGPRYVYMPTQDRSRVRSSALAHVVDTFFSGSATEAVAALLGGCSQRHVYRLADSGRMPRPVKLGALVRWRRNELVEWVAAGCPIVRDVRGGAR